MTTPNNQLRTVLSECIGCHEMRPCFKIECRPPLPEPVLVHTYDARGNPIREMVEYEAGPIAKICRSCLAGDHGVIASYFLDVLG